MSSYDEGSREGKSDEDVPTALSQQTNESRSHVKW
jgi:hypothetical protein